MLALGAASACATEENTLQGDDGTAAVGSDEPTAGTAGAPNGGKPASGGSPASSGTTSTAGTAGSGGKSGAFGGTSSTGGTGSGGDDTAGKGGTAGASAGSAGAAGKGGTGGTAGAGGKGGSGGSGGSGGTAGSSGAGGKGGSGGTSGTAGTGGGTTVECLENWKADACNTCTTQTQGDKLACVDILDCYAANGCGPTTCANNDDKCGVNKIAKGTAGYPIAAEVYDCLCK